MHCQKGKRSVNYGTLHTISSMLPGTERRGARKKKIQNAENGKPVCKLCPSAIHLNVVQVLIQQHRGARMLFQLRKETKRWGPLRAGRRRPRRRSDNNEDPNSAVISQPDNDCSALVLAVALRERTVTARTQLPRHQVHWDALAAATRRCNNLVPGAQKQRVKAGQHPCQPVSSYYGWKR